VFGSEGQVACQVVQAPDAPPGLRLVPDSPGVGGVGSEGNEIRLTYRELTALIEDAVRSLR
jgi:hypothetical protein